jgi:uroporphyrinogen III methyltransferase/synthase
VEEIQKHQSGIGCKNSAPMVYLVGAGPGDPGLITLRGKQLLERAEVIIYDHLASKKLLKYVPKSAEFIYAGKRGGVKHTHTQDEINQMLVDRAKAGKRVVRLKGGDPFIFGRGGEEIEEIVKAGLTFEVVPGVTSATAAATYAGIPITHRQYTSTVAFVTGHEDPTKPDSKIAWDKLATGVGTLVIYMGIKNLKTITQKLLRYGRDPKTPVAVVRWASTSEQRTVVGNLENIAEVVLKNKIKPPSLVIIGEVVNLRDTINWYEKRPPPSVLNIRPFPCSRWNPMKYWIKHLVRSATMTGCCSPVSMRLIIFSTVCSSRVWMSVISRGPELVRLAG